MRGKHAIARGWRFPIDPLPAAVVRVRVMEIRFARPDDSEQILGLILALAEYEKLTPPDAAAQERLIRDAFAARPRFEILVADFDGKLIGYAFFFETYSTFRALPTLYLEDLFVLSDYRKQRAGYHLFMRLVEEADTRGCGRLDFQVLDWNQLARDFYHRLGVQYLENWCPYRLDREQFGTLLAGAAAKG